MAIDSIASRSEKHCPCSTIGCEVRSICAILIRRGLEGVSSVSFGLRRLSRHFQREYGGLSVKARLSSVIGRTLVALALVVPAVAATGGAGAGAHATGVPLVAGHLSSPTTGGLTFSFPAPPIATAGSIAPGKTLSFTLRTKIGGVAASATVYICQCLDAPGIHSGVSGDSTTVPASQCNGVGQLDGTGGTLTKCQTDSNGALVMTYHVPANPPSQGRADWEAQDVASGAPSHKAVTHYVYCTVYRFSPTPIATAGLLTGGATRTVTLTAKDGLDRGIPGSTVYLSFKAASGGGSAKVLTTNLTSTPALFLADGSGSIAITYTAGSATTGQDAITAQDLAHLPKNTNSDAYAYATGTPVISVGDVHVYEGDQLPGILADFTLTVSPKQSSPVTVQYVTLCGVGDKGCGEDFKQVGTPVSVTIPANTTSTTILVRQFAYIGGNGGETYNEGWFVQLLNPGTGILGRSVGEGILFPDVEGVTTALADLYVGEAAAMPVADGNVPIYFTVTLGAKLTSAVTFTYATTSTGAGDTAVPGTDYTAINGTWTIPAGQTSVVIPVTLLAHAPPTSSKTFTFTISNASGGLTIARASGKGTVLSS